MSSAGVARPGDGRSFLYAGQPMRVLTELPELAAAEIVVPAKFGGPVAHIHHGFSEFLYIVDGELLLTVGHAAPAVATPGSLCAMPIGVRHTFANPHDEPVRAIGLWSPGSVGLAMVADIGAMLTEAGAEGVDPAAMAQLYARHNSELQP
jgi:mannose-6-phosphate isomerase-like protein (cupin superfamily)